MVWDVQGQGIAIAGARLLDLLPIFSEPISRSFSGEVPPASSFFFMTLFLHVALPLGLGALLWLHVSRVSRPALLPPRPMIRFLLAALGRRRAHRAARAAAGRRPAGAARGRARPTSSSPSGCRSRARSRLAPRRRSGCGLLGLLSAAPWWWRPRRGDLGLRGRREPLHRLHALLSRTAPTKRSRWCRARSSRSRSTLVARVDPDRCVGCGICAASCPPMGVGPENRDGRDQLAAARAYLDRHHPNGPTGREVVLIACRNGAAAHPERLALAGVALYPTGCSGSVHTSVVELLIRRGVGGVFVLSCPPRNCFFREGPKWLAARLENGRDAALHPRVDRRRVAFASLSATESPAIRAALADFQQSDRRTRTDGRGATRPRARLRASAGPRAGGYPKDARDRRGASCLICGSPTCRAWLCNSQSRSASCSASRPWLTCRSERRRRAPPSGSPSAPRPGRSRSAATSPPRNSRSSRSTCASPASARSSRCPTGSRCAVDGVQVHADPRRAARNARRPSPGHRRPRRDPLLAGRSSSSPSSRGPAGNAGSDR